MEKEPRKNRITQAFDIGNKQIGTVGNLLKLTQDIETDPKGEIVFYLEDKEGMLHAAKKDFIAIASVNALLEKLDPSEELPENLFVYIPKTNIVL